MPLRPPRRLPHAFQRRTSSLSRRAARRHIGRRREPDFLLHVMRMTRRWRRFGGNMGRSLAHLKLVCACGAGFALTAAVLFFLFSPLFSVSSIRVSRGDRRVDVGEIQKVLRPFFGRHLFSISAQVVAQDLQSAFPEVSSVRVGRNLPGELGVTLSMDPIAADVILGDPDDTEADVAAVDKGGMADVAETPHRYLTAQGIYLEYPFSLPAQAGVSAGLPTVDGTEVGDGAQAGDERLVLHLVDWAAKPVHRQRLLPGEVLRDVQNVRRILRESFGRDVQSVTFYLRAKEFHVRTPGYVLWFDLGSPVAAQLNRYRVFLRTLGQGDVEEYVDLRLHDRVVYR